MKTNRALIIGVESYKDPQLPRRPGTVKAMREVDLRLRQGGWETRFLYDGATVLHERAGLNQVLDSLEWIKDAGQALLIISAQLEDGRLFPFDVKSQFKQQSSLNLTDLATALPPSSGLIVDGHIPPNLELDVSWLLSTGEDPQPLFSEFGPTRFLHAIVVSLNECPLDKPLSVRTFFESVESNDAPSVMFKDYHSIESISILTPPPVSSGEADTAEHQAINLDDSLHGGRYLDNGRYHLLRVLGEGGIGQVYLAQDEQLGVKRAIKLLKIPDTITDDQREQIRGRMTQAALAAQTLSERTHHVVRVFDIKTDHTTGLPFTVMEFLSGETLSHRLYREPLNLEQVFEIGLTLVETMAVAHELKLIHRDLKPENVMLIERDGSDLFIKLLDFDLVKLDPSEAQVKTQEGQILGTLEYMSPEQLKGQPVDERADVFSLGAILYECFGGVRANPGRTQRALIQTLLDTGVKPLMSVNPKLPKSLCELIDRALSLDVSARPANAGELLNGLRALQGLRPSLSTMTFSTPRFSPHETITPEAITPEPLKLQSALTPEEEQAETIIPYDTSVAVAPPSGPPKPVDEALSADPTQLVTSSKGVTKEEVKRASVSSAIWAIAGALIVAGGVFLMRPQGRSSLPESGSSVSAEAPLAKTEATKVSSPPQSEAKELTQLHLLEVATPTWGSVQVAHEGTRRRYQGGRLSEQLSLFIYEAHFQHLTGDPPREAWSRSEALRWALTKRATDVKMWRDVKGLMVEQGDFERLITARPTLKRDPVLGEVLITTEGLLSLEAKGVCKGLKVGDTITALSWSVRGRRSLGGRCEAGGCLDRLSEARKKAKRYREPLRLKVSLTRWPLESRGATSPREETISQCVLR